MNTQHNQRAPRGSLRVIAIGSIDTITITGQSLAFRLFVDESSHEIRTFELAAEGESAQRRVAAAIVVAARLLLKALLKRVDVIYLHTSRSRMGYMKDLPILLIARLTKVPLVNHCHGGDFQSFRAGLTKPERKILDWSYRSIACTIVLADAMRIHFACYEYFMSVVVVRNPVPDDLKLLEISRGPVENRPINILFLSNIMREKGIEDLIEGIGLVSDSIKEPVAQLRIAGGFLKKDISADQLAAKITSMNNVEYLGVLRGNDKREALRWADIVALPSYYPVEGLPISLLEGLSAGCLLLATRAGFIEAELSDSAIFFVDKRSPESVARQVITVASRRAEIPALAKQNQAIARKRYSQEQFARAIDQVLIGAAKGIRV